MSTKVCSKCKEELALSCFSTNRANKKDGLQNQCKSCDNAYQRSRKDIKADWSREYAKKRRQNPSYRISMLLNASKQRAEAKGREHTITKEDILNKWPLHNKCPVFGFELEWNSAGFRETSPSIDRIDSSKGYTVDNIQIISWKANRLKSFATVKELEAVLSFMKQGEKS
jgi:hypothetical protein